MESRKELPTSVSNSTIGDENDGAYSSSDTEGPESDPKEEEKKKTVDSDSSDDGTDQDRTETSDVEATDEGKPDTSVESIEVKDIKDQTPNEKDAKELKEDLHAETSTDSKNNLLSQDQDSVIEDNNTSDNVNDTEILDKKVQSTVESVGPIEDIIVQDKDDSIAVEEVEDKEDLDDTSDLIQQVETGLKSHPMRMEEEVFDGYGEAEEEEEPAEESHVDEDVIEDVDIDVKSPNINEDSKSPIPVISVTNESSLPGKDDDYSESTYSTATLADTTADYETADSQITIGNEDASDVSITDNLSDCEEVRIQIESPIPQITVQEALQSVDVDEALEAQVEDSKSNKDTVEFDKNLPGTVEILISKVTGAKIYLVGTAHFSKESCEDVAKVINRDVESFCP